MATTTNYGWTTPDDTSLVKDGASAIRTLGSSVDTTVKNLNPETTLGDISYRSSTANTNTRLAIGTTGQVLSVSGGVPAWTTISSGGMTLIQETVANANSSITFGSIPGTYKNLLMTFQGIQHSTTGSSFFLRFNNDSTGGAYKGSYVGDNAASFARGFTSNTSTTSGSFPLFGLNVTSSSLEDTAMGWVEIDNYASASKLKTYRINMGYLDASTGSRIFTWLMSYNSTSAITSLDIVRTTGSATISNLANTSIRLYGVS